jgi:hypothetical protein
MTVTEVSNTESRRTATRPGHRRGWFRAAAAPAIVIVGSVAMLACDDDSSDKEASTGTTLSATDTGVAEQFIKALNDRDPAAITAMSTDGLTINSAVTGQRFPAEELPSLIAWYDAFDWRWEDATCETTSVQANAECELFERNRLTDLTGAERPATVSFTMTDGGVESVIVNADLSDYRNEFYQFSYWVRANHPDDATRMWTGNYPILSSESAALLDQHLTEYADQLPPTTDE